MLKLKRIEIQGFKSFYDRTEMKFPGNGIAAVVGPNGCGKSNLGDAISWVLGEQSAKSLRGARMEDVIFAGTRERKPLGMASVTMTLVPNEHHGPSVHAERHESEPGAEQMAERTGEVTITRRLYRSGESEYLINGKIARLRDIQDLFLGTGLGPESYAIIEQGRIGQILSNKPQDRRALIEEAAGITKFKTRKRLAEAKLEGAKQNLTRVFDILEEVTRQVNSLKRQASKAKRYKELKSEAAGYLRESLTAKFRLLERETAKTTIELNLASSSLQELQNAIAEREKEQAAVIESSYATEQELTQVRKQLADLELENERARGRLEYQKEQIAKIEQRLAAGVQESQALDAQRQQRSNELERQAADLSAIEDRTREVRQELEAKSAERQLAQARLTEQERGLETSRQKVLQLLNQASALKNRVTQFEAQLASADREAGRVKSEEQQSQSALERIEGVKKQISERLAARQTELISVTERRAAIEQELKEKRSQLTASRQSLDRIRSEFSRVRARKDSLEEIIQHRSYTTDTVKRLFTAVEHGKTQNLQPAGVLADFMEVDPRYEKAAEEFLHDELEYVVVRDWSEAENGIELMRGDLNGRATFLVEVPHGANRHLGQPAQAPAETETLTRLSEAVRFTNGLSNTPLNSLPRIANCYIAEDRNSAQRLANQYPHCWFLAPDGVSYHGQAVSGGKKSGAGPLALKRELREILQLEQAKQRELTEEEAKAAALERSVSALGEELERLRVQQQNQEKDVLALDHESRKLAEEFQQVQTRLSRARLDLTRIAENRQAIEGKVSSDRELLEQAEQEKTSQEHALEAAQAELGGLREEAARATEEHAAIRATLASLEERERALRAGYTQLESQVQEVVKRLETLSRERERLDAERDQLLANNTELETKRSDLSVTIREIEAQVNELAGRESELRNQLSAMEEQLKTFRAQAQSSQEQRANLQVALAKEESSLKHLEETCQNELDVTLQQLAETVETIAGEEEIREFDAKYAEVQQKIEALGPVNPQALEELEEAQQRHDFLSAQRQDLLDSIRDTEKLIREIDDESQKRFGEAFHAINAHFREMFKTLFGGGIGEMRLADEENLAESGIDIVASPPGKKLQSVLLLSGGEKALTAMALLMAIFQYTPSPFCILDEVDAPLDEPNIERLTKLLREMANETQFIVITHSKRTMEAAQSLYGVTMQEPGVSKLVSVKFTSSEEKTAKSRTVREERLEPALV